MADRLTEERLAELEALTSARLWRMSLKVEEAASLIAEVRASRAEKAQREWTTREATAEVLREIRGYMRQRDTLQLTIEELDAYFPYGRNEYQPAAAKEPAK